MKEEEKKKGQKLSNEDLENVNGGGRGKRKLQLQICQRYLTMKH